jgi:hypothetical protein
MSENSVKNIPKKDGFGITAVVLGACAVASSWIPFLNLGCYPLAIIGIIFGIISLCKSFKTKKFILPILSLIFCVLSISIASFANKTAYNAITGGNTEQILEKEISVELGKFTISDDGFTTKLPVTITNKTSQKKTYSIKIEAIDSSGTRIDEDTIYVTDLNAGQSIKKDAFTFKTTDKAKELKNATFKVLEVS